MTLLELYDDLSEGIEQAGKRSFKPPKKAKRRRGAAVKLRLKKHDKGSYYAREQTYLNDRLIEVFVHITKFDRYGGSGVTSGEVSWTASVDRLTGKNMYTELFGVEVDKKSEAVRWTEQALIKGFKEHPGLVIDLLGPEEEEEHGH